MKKKMLKIVIFLLLTLIAIVHSFYLTNLYSYDEIWNYGFAKNILDGLIPYKDFNMIIPPLFPYITAGILFIFGKKLIVYHILMAVLVTGITYLASKKIGWYSFLIYSCLLIYSTNGYNINSLFLLFLLLTILDKKTNKQEILIPIIISLMIQTKQTLVLLIIPNIIYSKNKKKTIAVYFVCFLLFLTYLLINNNLIEFIDYCFLGMFEFTEKNNLTRTYYFPIELVSCIFLLQILIKTKGERKDAFYCLMYQIITFPITDISHFVLGWAPVIYILFQKKELTKFIKISTFLVLLTIQVSILFMNDYVTSIKPRIYLDHNTSNTFLEGRLTPIITENYISTMKELIQRYPDHKLYILGNYSYLVKLYLDIPINKYDLINDGNMGYHGSQKYIQEIKKDCQNQSCLFIVNDMELTKKSYNQTNAEILEYVTKNYNKIYSSSVFGGYIT
ncbi:MAG: hypothetical protein MR598_02430 [Erysipelotrichaceae bacterium]|nr:hypothetical protein [Erysipelotrichaceae bacterium]